MPEEYKSSWADEVELDSGTLPPPTEIIDAHGQKVVTEYKFNKDDKKIKVVRTYKVTKHVVSKSIARRKKLPKFGDSTKDADGPAAHTTFVSEEITMQLVTSKEEEKSNDTVLDPKSEFYSAITATAVVNTFHNLSPQINSPNVASAMAVISPPTVPTDIQPHISRRFSRRSQRHRRSPWRAHRSPASTFHPSSRTCRRMRARAATIRQPFESPICPSRHRKLIWRI